MSENTGTVDTTATNGNGNDDATNGTTLNAEQLNYLLGLAAKEQERKAKAEEAKEARRRANGRPIDPATGKEVPAATAFLMSEATLLKNWIDTYAGDPEQFVNRMRDQFVPMIVALADTPSVMMASAYDNNRRTLNAWKVPANLKPTAPATTDAPKPTAPKSSK